MTATTQQLPLQPLELPAGEYVIADPCCVLIDRYDEILDATGDFGMESSANGGVWRDPKSGKLFAVFSTAYGDGEYSDNFGRRYPVDSGCLGCFPVEMVEADSDLAQPTEDGDTPAGHRMTLETTRRSYEHDGRLHFGPVSINTSC